MAKQLRILHLGNIANNAYLNARLLNERGHINHVACYDFYHFAGCSEWQDLAFDIDKTVLGDPSFPDFWRLGERCPSVPHWFALGPQPRVLAYLMALNSGDKRLEWWAWRCLRYGRFKVIRMRDTLADSRPWTEEEFQAALAASSLTPADRLEICAGRMAEQVCMSVRTALRRTATNEQVATVALPLPRELLAQIATFDRGLAALLSRVPPQDLLAAIGLEGLPQAEPAMAPRQVPGVDTRPYELHLAAWHRLFAGYDIVMAYGAAAILPFLAGQQRYVAYEHGTLRDIPFEDTTLGKLVAPAYEQADLVFVTNNDYLIQPRQLAIPASRLCPLPHAFDERQLRRHVAATRPVRPAQTTFFAPARQDWVQQYPTLTKNNHFVVHAAAALVVEGYQDFRVVFVEWGVDVAATRQLIRELGVDTQFEWITPLAKRQLWEAYASAHAVIDQFLLPSISGVSFEALALGCRVITRDDGVSNHLAFGEQPPLLAADDISTVTQRMREVLDDPQDLAGIGQQAWEWVDRCHSAARIVAVQEERFRALLAEISA